jgi:hypothetical protein
VAALLELFPSAKFVHVRRDPAEVFLSMRRLWREVILPGYSLQRIAADEVDAIIVHHYRVLMSRFERDRSLIRPGHITEMRYEALIDNPLVETRRIYEELGLPAFGEAEAAIRRRLARDRPDRPARHRVTPEEARFIERELGDWRQRLGYGPVGEPNQFSARSATTIAWSDLASHDSAMR